MRANNQVETEWYSQMNNGLAPGDLATIVQSVMGVSVGKIVQCVDRVGVHSQYGVVWNVRSKDAIVTEYGGHGNSAHVPEIWLRKIKPGELDKQTNRNLERVDQC